MIMVHFKIMKKLKRLLLLIQPALNCHSFDDLGGMTMVILIFYTFSHIPFLLVQQNYHHYRTTSIKILPFSVSLSAVFILTSVSQRLYPFLCSHVVFYRSAEKKLRQVVSSSCSSS